MATEYTAVIKQQGEWWVGWIEEVPGVNCQEQSLQELIESVRITLREAIEFNRQDAIASAGTEYTEEKIAVPA
jgi:predicted RNase H-like HicB family nuclease